MAQLPKMVKYGGIRKPQLVGLRSICCNQVLEDEIRSCLAAMISTKFKIPLFIKNAFSRVFSFDMFFGGNPFPCGKGFCPVADHVFLSS